MLVLERERYRLRREAGRRVAPITALRDRRYILVIAVVGPSRPRPRATARAACAAARHDATRRGGRSAVRNADQTSWELSISTTSICTQACTSTIKRLRRYKYEYTSCSRPIGSYGCERELERGASPPRENFGIASHTQWQRRVIRRELQRPTARPVYGAVIRPPCRLHSHSLRNDDGRRATKSASAIASLPEE